MKRIILFLPLLLFLVACSNIHPSNSSTDIITFPIEENLKKDTITSSAQPTDAPNGTEENVESDVPADFVDFLKNDLYELICEIQYYNGGAYPMGEITDEQKIAFGLVVNNAKEETLRSIYEKDYVRKDTLILAEDVDKIVDKYFYAGIGEHKTISGYVDAEYENGIYRVTYGSPIGANIYYLDTVAVLPLTDEDLSTWQRAYWTDAPENEDIIICTADLIYTSSSYEEIIGKSIITLVNKDDTYKLYSYRQEVLSDWIVIGTTYP